MRPTPEQIRSALELCDKGIYHNTAPTLAAALREAQAENARLREAGDALAAYIDADYETTVSLKIVEAWKALAVSPPADEALDG